MARFDYRILKLANGSCIMNKYTRENVTVRINERRIQLILTPGKFISEARVKWGVIIERGGQLSWWFRARSSSEPYGPGDLLVQHVELVGREIYMPPVQFSKQRGQLQK